MLILRNLYQKEFGARTRNQQRRIANADSQAQAQLAKIDKWTERYNKTAENVSKNFGGDVEKFLEANPRMKGTYQNGPHREALDNILGGQKVTEQASIQKHSASAKKQVDAAADQVHNYRKTHKSVRVEDCGFSPTGSGNVFNTQGREFVVQEGIKGDVSINTRNKTGDLNRWSRVTSSTNKRREVQVGKLENVKELSSRDYKGLILHRPGVGENKLPDNATKINFHSAKRRGLNSRSIRLDERGEKIIKKTSTVSDALARPEIVKTPTNATKIKPKSANKAHDVLVEEGNKISKNNYLKRNKKALLIGTGVAAAAGAGAIAYKHIKNKKDNKGE